MDDLAKLIEEQQADDTDYCEPEEISGAKIYNFTSAGIDPNRISDETERL
jgi:hypothetical protein